MKATWSSGINRETNNTMFDRRGKVGAARFASQVGPTCCKCHRAALRRVGARGYCREHMGAAIAHMKERQYQSEYGAKSRGTASSPD
jgi:hypothetical protein